MQERRKFYLLFRRMYIITQALTLTSSTPRINSIQTGEDMFLRKAPCTLKKTQVSSSCDRQVLILETLVNRWDLGHA
jgi:hypothetical protein